MKILVINPGSTSTKIAVFENESAAYSRSLHHDRDELSRLKTIEDQYTFLKNLVLKALEDNHITCDFDAIVARGGLGKPIPGGAYRINELMISDNLGADHPHPTNLGTKLAYELASTIPSCLALTADPGRVDELLPIARITGMPELHRICFWHALNHRAVARRYAAKMNNRYEEMNLIVCHLGGGISVAAHNHGRAIDVNNAYDGGGSFSTERSGTLPSADLVRLSFSGKYTEQQLLHKITGQGGLYAYLGTNDLREVMRRVEEGDEQAKILVDAMVLNVSKQICAESAILCGHIDAILITGGMSRNEYVVEEIKKRVSFLAPFACYPGEFEMEALAEDALAVLKGDMELKEYV